MPTAQTQGGTAQLPPAGDRCTVVHPHQSVLGQGRRKEKGPAVWMDLRTSCSVTVTQASMAPEEGKVQDRGVQGQDTAPWCRAGGLHNLVTAGTPESSSSVESAGSVTHTETQRLPSCPTQPAPVSPPPDVVSSRAQQRPVWVSTASSVWHDVKPDPPEAVRLSPLPGRQLQVHWEPPRSWPFPEVFSLKYWIRYRRQGASRFRQVGPIEATSFTLRAVRPQARYCIQVAAQDVTDYGELSDWSLPAAPPPMTLGM
ncbi:interleukin-27 subunit beta isoform X1 [Marmota monax]|uniref:interleukin-27 subunit beta isoform X1 n=1 Tax=Marmota monax TaxID=9995 RepID=UPI0026ECEAC7|nr:interleukin-27 subunit beta isoform X1 [Marmota monax]